MTNPYRTLRAESIYRDHYVHLRRDEVEFPGGAVRPFTVVEIKAGAAVLAVDNENHVHLVREFKYGIGRPALEVVGGGIDAHEEPLDAARRELREEAGLTAREWVSLGVMDPLPSLVDCPLHLYLARALEAVPREPDDGEVLEVVRMPLTEAVDLVLRGDIRTGSSCVLILKAAAWLRAPSCTVPFWG